MMPGRHQLARQPRWRRLLRRATTPQPVLVVSGRRTRAVRRSPLRRVMPYVLMAGLAVATGLSSLAFLEAQRRLYTQETTIEKLRAERAELAERAEAAASRAEQWKQRTRKARRRLEAKGPARAAAKAQLNELRKTNAGLRRTVDQLKTEIAHRSQRGAGLARQLRQANDKLAKLKDARAQLADRLARQDRKVNTLSQRLAARQAEISTLQSRLERRESEVARLKTRKASLAGRVDKLKANLEAALKGRNAHLRRWRQERQAHKKTQAQLTKARQARQVATERANRLHQQLSRVSARTSELVARLDRLTDERTEAVRAALKNIGPEAMRLAQHVDGNRLPGGTGGPLKPAKTLDQAGSGKAPQGLKKLRKRLAGFADSTGKLGRLQGLLQRLPLARPVDHYWVSSDYGMREDPFTGGRAMHEGLDMAGLANRPIYAAASGTVVSAGWNGGYGRQVVIDHGLGIKTRYAHLAGLEVEDGEKVNLRERIGRMGSSGRSKDTHLHYEVQIDDKRLDPTHFIEAGSEICPL